MTVQDAAQANGYAQELVELLRKIESEQDGKVVLGSGVIVVRAGTAEARIAGHASGWTVETTWKELR